MSERRNIVPVCPYCRNKAKLTDSAHLYGGRSYGLVWDCRPCDAYVGVHKGTTVALGRLANAELRAWKIKAHAAFDPLWRSGRMTRHEAYALLGEKMKLPPKRVHIGMFDIDQCKRVVVELRGAEAD
jgi:hypothetical protein